LQVKSVVSSQESYVWYYNCGYALLLNRKFWIYRASINFKALSINGVKVRRKISIA